MKYPTQKQVEDASHLELARFHRFLKSPMNESEQAILSLVSARFKELGGMTPKISKAIGWND